MRYASVVLALCGLCLASAIAQEPVTAKPAVTSFDCPKYPAKAESMGLQGMVKLEVTTDGHRVTSVKVTSGHPVLSQAASQNVETWQFADHSPTTFPVTYFFVNQSGAKKGSITSDAGSKCSAKMELPDTVTVTTRAPFPLR